MTLNCLCAHNTGHQRRSRRWNALESPELRRRAGFLFKFTISNWTSERNWVWQGARCSVHFLFLLAIWTLLMLGSDVSVVIFTLRYGNTGTIVQLCWTQYYVNESSCPRDHILFKRNQYHQATLEPAAINGNYISSFDSAELNTYDFTFIIRRWSDKRASNTRPWILDFFHGPISKGKRICWKNTHLPYKLYPQSWRKEFYFSLLILFFILLDWREF